MFQSNKRLNTRSFTRAGYAARPIAKYTLIIKIYFRIYYIKFTLCSTYVRKVNESGHYV